MSFLADERVCLRAVEPQDLEIVYRMENDTELWGCSYTNVPYSRYAVKQFLSDTANDIYSDRQIRLVAERVDNGEPVGFADLTDFSPRHLRAEVGVVVFPEQRHAGYGKSILALLEAYACRHLLIHNIYAVVAENNEPAVRLFRAAGFDFKTLLADWLAHADGYGNAWLCQKILR